MNIRIILQDESGKRFTLPVKDVHAIRWETEEEHSSLICLGAEDRSILELPAGTVRTIYRDDEKAKPTTPRVPKARRAAAPAPPDPE